MSVRSVQQAGNAIGNCTVFRVVIHEMKCDSSENDSEISCIVKINVRDYAASDVYGNLPIRFGTKRKTFSETSEYV